MPIIGRSALPLRALGLYDLFLARLQAVFTARRERRLRQAGEQVALPATQEGVA